MFDELQKTPFRPRLKMVVAWVCYVQGLASFFGRGCRGRDLWVVPKRATRDADIGDVYGVSLEDEDEDTDDEDLEHHGEVASSSSSDLHNPPAVTSSNPTLQLAFLYDVGEAVSRAMKRGRMHEWTHIEFQAIGTKHGLSSRGAKGESMERVRVHFQRLYRL